MTRRARSAGAILAPLLLLLWSAPALPEVARVRSGEHATFSRLVFADVAGRGWTVARSDGDRVRIRFSEGAPQLDLTGIFDFIPRDRLREAVSDAGDLVLTLACDCPVEVAQLRTGHVVIDIGDAPPDESAVASPVGSLDAPPVVQWRLEPLPISLPDVAPSLPARSRGAAAPSPDLSAPPARPAQVRILPSREVPLIPRDNANQAPVSLATACPFEATASDILSQDPVAALDDLTGGLAELLDGQDRIEPQRVDALARRYLVAGFGTEAIQVASLGDEGGIAIEVIGAIFDDTAIAAPLDPGCGPATTLLALLDRRPTDDWDRADHSALVTLLDGLPAARWRDIRGRLAARLDELGHADLLVGVHGGQPETGSAAAPTSAAIAGTDAAAIAAVTADLAAAAASGLPTEEIRLVNALALRRSIPAGPDRAAFDSAVLSALVISRHPVEAVDLVREGAVAADDLLELVLADLPAAAALEFLVRLRPHLGAESRRDPRVIDIFDRFGLPEGGARFAGRPPSRLPRAATDGVLAEEPWLARDLIAMTTAPREDWTARNRLAQAILDRNAAAVPRTDLAAARAVLGDSRKIGGRIEELLAETPPS